MITKSPPGHHIAHTELEQPQHLTKIISDGTVEGPYDGSARRTGGQAGAKAGSHELERLRDFHDQLLSAAACRPRLDPAKR
jgi:hypothetical protein